MRAFLRENKMMPHLLCFCFCFCYASAVLLPALSLCAMRVYLSRDCALPTSMVSRSPFDVWRMARFHGQGDAGLSEEMMQSILWVPIPVACRRASARSTSAPAI